MVVTFPRRDLLNFSSTGNQRMDDYGFSLDDAVPENTDDVYEEPDNDHVGGHARSTAGMGLDELAPRA